MKITLRWDGHAGDGKTAFVVAEENDGWKDLRIEVDTDDCDGEHARAMMQEVINRCNRANGCDATTSSFIKMPEPWDACAVVTKDHKFYEGTFVGRLGGLLLFRTHDFWSNHSIPRAIRVDDVEQLVVVMRTTSTTCNDDYDRALASLLRK